MAGHSPIPFVYINPEAFSADLLARGTLFKKAHIFIQRTLARVMTITGPGVILWSALKGFSPAQVP
jgi:hypothetical protein